MENGTSSTRIIGYPSYVDLSSKKSAVISNETIVTNIEQIKSDIGLDFQNPVNFNVDEVEYYNDFGYSYADYFPGIWFNIVSAGTYDVVPNVRQSIYLVEAASISEFSSDIRYTADFVVQNCSQLVSFSLPSLLKHMTEIGIQFIENPNLTTIDMPLLEEITNSEFFNETSSLDIIGNPFLQTVNVPLLKNASIRIRSDIDMENLTLNINSLENVIGLELKDIYNIYTDFSSIKTIQGLNLSFPAYFNDGTSILFQNVTHVKNSPNVTYDIRLSGFGIIESFSMPNVIKYDDGIRIFIQSCDDLSGLILGTVGVLKQANSPYINLQGAANFTSAQAEVIVAPFVSLDGTNGTILSENGQLYIDLSETPSPTLQGYFDTLTARGWNVVVND